MLIQSWSAGLGKNSLGWGWKSCFVCLLVCKGYFPQRKPTELAKKFVRVCPNMKNPNELFGQPKYTGHYIQAQKLRLHQELVIVVPLPSRLLLPLLRPPLGHLLGLPRSSMLSWETRNWSNRYVLAWIPLYHEAQPAEWLGLQQSLARVSWIVRVRLLHGGLGRPVKIFPLVNQQLPPQELWVGVLVSSSYKPQTRKSLFGLPPYTPSNSHCRQVWIMPKLQNYTLN